MLICSTPHCRRHMLFIVVSIARACSDNYKMVPYSLFAICLVCRSLRLQLIYLLVFLSSTRAQKRPVIFRALDCAVMLRVIDILSRQLTLLPKQEAPQ